jgi:hypothetical protein
MSKNFDTVSNSAHATPHGWENNRCIEFAESLDLYCRLYIDAANDLWYSFGRGASWIDQQLTGAAGVLGNNVAVGNASIALDNNNDDAHIAYVDTTNMQINFCHLHVLNGPAVGGNWHTWGPDKFTRVDTGASDKHCVSVCDDGIVNNGGSEPHVIWDDDTGAGNWRIRMASSTGGPTHSFGAPIILASTPGELHPTIICTAEEGRELYAFWVSADSQDIECKKCLDGANPAVAVNWGGPLAGAGAGVDIAIQGQVGDVASPPSASWWWDADERVNVATALVGTTDLPVTNYWDETAGPAAWAGQVNASNPNFGVPIGVMIVNRGNANKWTMYAHDGAAGLEYALKDGSYSFAGVPWYDQATTGPSPNSYMSCEWRHLEVISANHSVVVWVDGASNLWYGETRINTSKKPTLVNPIAGIYRNELTAIEFDWTFEDDESDLQRSYWADIDDTDDTFGSLVGDPGSNFRLSRWHPSALDDQTLNAEVLAADTTYYWRVRTKDSEFGTEYDPDSTSDYSTTGSFKTTPPFTMNITSSSQQADKSCAIDFWLNLPGGVGWDDDVEITMFQYNDGGGLTSCTYDSTYHVPFAEIPFSIVITGGTEYFTVGWNSDFDVEPPSDTYDEQNITISITARYTSDAHSLGTVNDTLATVDLDFKSPTSVSLGAPVGGTTTIPKPTFSVGASDTNDWAFNIQIHRDSGRAILFEDSGWQPYNTTTWQMTNTLDAAGTWYVQVKTRDDSISNNVNPSWTQGDFDYAPPSDPRECAVGVFDVEVSPNRAWDGTEFNIEDDILELSASMKSDAFHTLSFTLNNYAGKYMDTSSSTLIEQGMEVTFTRASQMFLGIIVGIQSEASDSRTVKVYCESFASAASAYPIQLRVIDTSTSSHYWEDYILMAMSETGLFPNWFKLVDGDGNVIDLNTVSTTWNKTEVAPGADIVFDKVTFIDFMNEVSARTNKTWYESYDSPDGQKKYIYFTDAANPNEDDADHTLYLDSDIINAALRYNEDNIINTIVYKDADVIEQDMDSIREYGRHTMYRSSEGVEDMERLIEMAQYILSQYAYPIIEADIPLESEHPEIYINELAQIYEVQGSTNDAKTGFNSKMRVVGIDYNYTTGMGMTTNVILDSYWENPIIRRIIEGNKSARSSDASDPLVILRAETGEIRIDDSGYYVGMDAESTFVAFRIGIDRWSDSETDSDYVSNMGDR